MENLFWNNEKNEWLKEHREVCFEDVVLHINTDHVLAIVDNPNQDKYPGQKIIILNIEGYAYLVPFVIQKDGIFLKTIIPSRKHTKKYLEENDA